MTNPRVRPSSVDCGRCRASTMLEWVPMGDDAWSGIGRCPSCRSGIISFFSESGFHPDDLLALSRAMADGDDGVIEEIFMEMEAPKKGGVSALIA